MAVAEFVGCHWCEFYAPTLREVWRHEETEHPVERAEEDRKLAAGQRGWKRPPVTPDYRGPVV